MGGTGFNSTCTALFSDLCAGLRPALSALPVLPAPPACRLCTLAVRVSSLTLRALG